MKNEKENKYLPYIQLISNKLMCQNDRQIIMAYTHRKEKEKKGYK